MYSQQQAKKRINQKTILKKNLKSYLLNLIY